MVKTVVGSFLGSDVAGCHDETLTYQKPPSVVAFGKDAGSFLEK